MDVWMEVIEVLDVLEVLNVLEVGRSRRTWSNRYPLSVVADSVRTTQRVSHSFPVFSPNADGSRDLGDFLPARQLDSNCLSVLRVSQHPSHGRSESLCQSVAKMSWKMMFFSIGLTRFYM